jgi:hypothetical protein
MIVDVTIEELKALPVYEVEEDFTWYRDLELQVKLESYDGGIGHYEYWGESGYDSQECWRIRTISISTELSGEERVAVEYWIKENLDTIQEIAIEQI